MGGGILQIAAYGAQDLYVTGNPQITFFKICYRRHTNFAIQPFEHAFLDNPGFGRMSELKIFRLGDLITKMILKISISPVIINAPIKFAWVRRLGYAILNYVSIEIGGQVIDKQYGEWLEIWYELARLGKQERGYAHMLGDIPLFTEYNTKSKPQCNLMIPLKFWFNRHVGLALPLIAIHYHDIFVRIRFNDIANLIITNTPNIRYLENVIIQNVSLITDYVYLDMKERREFATNIHEYLIEKVQFTGEASAKQGLNRSELIGFNFPTKELIWYMKNANYTSSKKFLCYSNSDDWSNELQICSRNILEHSIYLSCDNTILPVINECIPSWESFEPGTKGCTINKNIRVINESNDLTLFINTNSLVVIFPDNNYYSLTNKISACIHVFENNTVDINSFVSKINDRDVSIPLDMITDTRFYVNEQDYVLNNGVYVNQFINHGVNITGSVNPLIAAKLEYNDQERFEKRNGNFFNYLQPEMHHNNTPTDGVNVYSFAIRPEDHQPTGTSNLSMIENIILSMWFDDVPDRKNEKMRYRNNSLTANDINLFNNSSKLYIFGFCYNILRIMNGFAMLVYTN